MWSYYTIDKESVVNVTYNAVNVCQWHWQWYKTIVQVLVHWIIVIKDHHYIVVHCIGKGETTQEPLDLFTKDGLYVTGWLIWLMTTANKSLDKNLFLMRLLLIISLSLETYWDILCTCKEWKFYVWW